MLCYKAKQEIVSSLCYLVSIQTEHCMCACVILYQVIILNTRKLRVTIIKEKFDLKLNSKGSRRPYSVSGKNESQICIAIYWFSKLIREVPAFGNFTIGRLRKLVTFFKQKNFEIPSNMVIVVPDNSSKWGHLNHFCNFCVLQ